MTTSRTLRDLLAWGTCMLRRAGIESASIDTQLLAAFVLGQSRTYVLTYPEIELTPAQEQEFQTLIERRYLHEPVAYLVGSCEFMALTFTVNKHVLIPRADTEALVETAISEVNARGIRSALEIGVGSGCIAVSLAVNCPAIHITAVDISEHAIDVARANAITHGVDDRVTFVHGDIFDDNLIGNLAAYGPFEMLLSNPPYISAAEMTELPPNVRGYEPHAALLGGPDGLSFYREITRRAPVILGCGVIMLEIGCNQADQVSGILRGGGFRNVNKLQDLAGKNRVIQADYLG